MTMTTLNMTYLAKKLLAPALLLAPLIACAGDIGDDDDDDNGVPVEVQCTEPTEVTCRDQELVDLEMNPDQVWGGDITSEDVGGFFHSRIDATAGGAFGGTGGYNYAKFTADGLQKVEINDDESFESMDWDFGFRRFVVRLNSGTAGPSCVTAARTAPDTDFASLDAVPGGLTFNKEEFYNDQCELVPDGSGLPNSPGVVMQNYWEYPGCVAMTGNVYVVRLADGHHVKLRVTNYYNDQDTCDIDNVAGTGSGNIQLDWAFLD